MASEKEGSSPVVVAWPFTCLVVVWRPFRYCYMKLTTASKKLPRKSIIRYTHEKAASPLFKVGNIH